jgi:uncharacterized protein (TIGR00297 family)
LGALLALAGALLILLTRQGTPAGALAGFAVATICAAGFGVGALVPLAIFVLGSGVLTRIGRDRKERVGAAQADRGRRGAPHVAAKLSLPALAAMLAVFGAAPQGILALAYAAAIAGAFADTAATELGPVIGGSTVAVRGGRFVPVSHGVPGGISFSGMLAATLASVAVALGALSVRLLGSVPEAFTAAAAGAVASVLESFLAGTALGARAGHYGRNFFLSLASACLALSARALGWTGA